MKEIGGYFELELANNEEYHKEAIKLDSGRNAFKYILKSQNISKVYIPNFICNSIIEPLEELSIQYEFYNINVNFEIIQKINVKKNEKLFYVNYFSVKSLYIDELAEKYSNKLIIDNTQAFFERPIDIVDTIYSPRKFFGVSDGGYLFTSNILNETLEKDTSYLYFVQLIGRSDKNATDFYDEYQKAEQRLVCKPMKHMSNLTQNILSSIDYNIIIKKRKENFYFLKNKLSNLNQFKFDNNLNIIPFVYPFMTNNHKLRDELIKHKIYVAKYWDEVLTRKNITKIEKDFVNKIIPLPIDQRYNIEDMQRIIKIIKEFNE